MEGRVQLEERMPSAPRMRREGTAVSPLGRGGIASPAKRVMCIYVYVSTYTQFIPFDCIFLPHFFLSLFLFFLPANACCCTSDGALFRLCAITPAGAWT